MVSAGCRVALTAHSGRSGTISIMIRGRRGCGNGMKPRIQGVLKRWKPGFIASGTGSARMIN